MLLVLVEGGKRTPMTARRTVSAPKKDSGCSDTYAPPHLACIEIPQYLPSFFVIYKYFTAPTWTPMFNIYTFAVAFLST